MDETRTPINEAQDEPEMTEQQISEQSRIRREKLLKLQEAGNNPFAQKTYNWTHASRQILDDFASLEGVTVSVAGRLISKRVMGKAIFCHLQDGVGRIQIYVRKDEIGDDAFASFKELDIGDLLGVIGKVFRTNTGEISIKAHEYTLLSKALLPLPEKFHGLRDPDARYRQRYVDLIVNPHVKDTFVKRSRAISAIREFLTQEGFIEVDTPVLHTLETGAEARPFETHLNVLDMHLYLRIEVELYLKRLIVGGLDRVFEIARIFRNEGMSVKHNPEFTMCEFYQAYTDYYGMMDIIERLFSQVAQKVCGTMKIPYQGIEIDLTPPWRRITMADAVKEYAGVDYKAWESDEQARSQLKTMGIERPDAATKGECLALLFEEKCEHHLVQPTILMDYPVEISPLAKRKESDPMFTERFEFFIYGREGGNAFTELNDPIDQRERFVEQVNARRAEGSATAEVDEDFLRAMEYGMPPTGGLGFGVDRFVMLLTDSPSIRDVLLFPTMRPKG